MYLCASRPTHGPIRRYGLEAFPSTPRDEGANSVSWTRRLAAAYPGVGSVSRPPPLFCVRILLFPLCSDFLLFLLLHHGHCGVEHQAAGPTCLLEFAPEDIFIFAMVVSVAQFGQELIKKVEWEESEKEIAFVGVETPATEISRFE